MPRTPAWVAAETAQRILATGQDLFVRRGYAAVCLEEVASSASVTRGAVYHHYGSKKGLFKAVAAHLQAEVAAEVSSAAESVAAEEQLRVGSHAFLDAITSDGRVRVLLIDAPAVIGWAEWREMDAENSVTMLREALCDAAVDDSELDAMVAYLSGAMNEAALWLAQHPDDEAAHKAAHRVLDRLLTSVVRVS